MKKIFLLMLCVFALKVNAQDDALQIIATAGNHDANANISLSWTMGPIAIESNTNDVVLISGVTQPNIDVVSSVEQFAGVQYKIYPNPSADRLYINSNNIANTMTYHLIDLRGNSLKQGILISSEEINLESLAAGTYILILNGISTYKIIKK